MSEWHGRITIEGPDGKIFSKPLPKFMFTTDDRASHARQIHDAIMDTAEAVADDVLFEAANPQPEGEQQSGEMPSDAA